jgi:DNA-binding protein YbaB
VVQQGQRRCVEQIIQEAAARIQAPITAILQKQPRKAQDRLHQLSVTLKAKAELVKIRI